MGLKELLEITASARDKKLSKSTAGRKAYKWERRKLAARRWGSETAKGAAAGFGAGAVGAAAVRGAETYNPFAGPKTWAKNELIRAVVNRAQGITPMQALAGGTIAGGAIGLGRGVYKGFNPWHASREHTLASKRAYTKTTGRKDETRKRRVYGLPEESQAMQVRKRKHVSKWTRRGALTGAVLGGAGAGYGLYKGHKNIISPWLQALKDYPDHKKIIRDTAIAGGAIGAGLAVGVGAGGGALAGRSVGHMSKHYIKDPKPPRKGNKPRYTLTKEDREELICALIEAMPTPYSLQKQQRSYKWNRDMGTYQTKKAFGG